jgi:regulator of RNase E activity RraA
MNQAKQLTHAELLKLKRWNTPSVYNGWEQITRHRVNNEGFNLEPVKDFMPHMGSMIGYAVTVIIEPGNQEHTRNNPDSWTQYREYVASVPGPKIVVVQDIDKPVLFGAFWGEVNSNIHKALGCVGTIIDGGIRDIDEMNNAGFKAIARGVCVGHSYSCPVRWNCEVEVFGCAIRPGQLIHADKHGFLVIPEEDQSLLLDAIQFMDANECETVIPAARDSWNKPTSEILKMINEASVQFSENVKNKFNSKGEW